MNDPVTVTLTNDGASLAQEIADRIKGQALRVGHAVGSGQYAPAAYAPLIHTNHTVIKVGACCFDLQVFSEDAMVPQRRP